MWHSSRGDRTLRGGEATLVAAAIDTMIDALMVYVEVEQAGDLEAYDQAIPDCESGIPAFDQLDACQRIGLLHQLANYLLTDTSRALKLSATAEAGVAAIFIEIRDQIAIEIDLQASLTADDSFHWRRRVVEASHELAESPENIEMIPSVAGQELSVWEDAVDMMASGILWDRDFEMAEGFLDADPSESQRRRNLLGIDPDYFTGVTPDPSPENVLAIVRETRDLVRSKPR